jgi:chromosome segregation ATPase
MESIWSELRHLRGGMDELRLEVVRLQYQNGDKDIEIETTKLSNEYMRGKVDRNKRKRRTLQTEVDSLKHRTIVAEKRADILEVERDTIRTEFHQLQSELARLNRRITTDEEKRKKLRHPFNILKQSIGPEDKEAAEAMQELQTLLIAN